MDKPSKDATKHAKASIKEAIGMLIGNPTVQAEGAAEKADATQRLDQTDARSGKDA